MVSLKLYFVAEVTSQARAAESNISRLLLGPNRLLWMTAATAAIVVHWPVTPAGSHRDGQAQANSSTPRSKWACRSGCYCTPPIEQTANDAAQAVFARIAELNRIMSDYDPDSELSRLSTAAPTEQGVAVSDDLWRVLSRSQELANQSAGAFDVTVGPYVRLWRRARREKELPSTGASCRGADRRSAINISS